MKGVSRDPARGTPGRAAFGAAALLVGCVWVRMTTSHDFFPAWGGDPLTTESPILGLTPAVSLALDAITTLASMLLLAAMRARGIALPWWEHALAAAGWVAVTLHAWMLGPGGDMQGLLLGGTWCSGIAAALAARCAARDATLRNLVFAGLLAAIGPLFLRGLAQVYIEHPMLLETYRADRAAILGSHGWTEDSPMARAYERRLLQSEATGWFGMANVYASVAAATLAALFALLVAAARSRATRSGLLAAAPGLGALMAAGALAYAKSKGGAGAFALGFLLVVLAHVGPRVLGLARGRWASIVGIGAPVLVLLMVVARGLVGTRFGELSLLFRWFYIEGAVQVWLDRPLLGVGPTGFKAAYTLLKPPIAPEDVSSPHSILFDYAATLGVGGMAWGALFLAWMRTAGKQLFGEPPQSSGLPPLRLHGGVLILSMVGATLVGSLLERAVATPEMGLVRIGGLVLASLIGVGVLTVLADDRMPRARLALAAAAITAGAHAQIELTSISPGSVAWLLAIVACGAPAWDTKAVPRVPWALWWLAPACLLAVIAVRRGWRWEAPLRLAYESVTPVADMDARLRDLATRPRADDSPRRIIADLGTLLGEPELERRALTGEDVTAAMLRLRLRATGPATEELAIALDREPRDFQTWQALTRLLLVRLGDLRQAGAEGESLDEALARVRQTLDEYRGPADAASQGWRATMHHSLSQMLPSEDDLRLAVRDWEEAAALAPHGVLIPLSLARANALLGETVQAREWASRALENHAKVALDPLQGLTEAQIVEMRGLAGR
ncbi:MAG: O-antigen ligase family protein [Phycisphaerales bacterium]